MALTYTPASLLQIAQFTGSNTTLYTTPPNTKFIISSAVLLNTDAANQTVTLHVVPNGDAAGTDTIAIDPKRNGILAPGQSYPSPELQGTVLNAGDTIQGLASTTLVVNLRVYGYRIAGG